MDAAALKKIPVFSELSDENLHAMSTFADEVSVSEGKILVSEGDYSYEFMAIQDGTAEVTRGGEHVADLGPGDFFGEVGLLERERRNATVVAKTGMRLVTFTRWDMKRLQKAEPEAYAEILKAMEDRKPS